MFLWDNDAQLIDCNEAAIRILKAESKEWLLSRKTTVAEMSPEYQPDGRRSVPPPCYNALE